MKNNLESPPVLSLCMIVKDESKSLPRCLDSVRSYVDEIIIVDTGSQDNTVEIVLQYGAIVKHFQWCDDFAAARNYSIAQASGDWILVLDADEELVVLEPDFLSKKINSETNVLGYFLPYIEVEGDAFITPLYRLRLFRNSAGIKYVGRLHETPYYQNQDFTEDRAIRTESLRILHYGSEKEKARQKNINRNLPILERAQKEEGLSLMLLYFLAGMYEEAGQQELAQVSYAEILKRLGSNLIEGNKPDPFLALPAILYKLGLKSINQSDYETARLLSQRGLEWCPDYPPLNFLTGLALRELGFPLGAIAYFEYCIQLGKEETYYKGEGFDSRFMTTYPAFELGCTYLQIQCWQDALAAFEWVLACDPNYKEAQEKIDEIQQLLSDG